MVVRGTRAALYSAQLVLSDVFTQHPRCSRHGESSLFTPHAARRTPHAARRTPHAARRMARRESRGAARPAALAHGTCR
jgi:hypothetical protein